MSKIILASNSPRRKEILQREGIDFIVDASNIEEVLDETLPIEECLKKLAYDKGIDIALKYPNDIVISADTTVYHNDKIIGKAKNREDAKNILLSLSNNTHVVYSSICIFVNGEAYRFIDKTKVVFKDITTLIDDYLDDGEWIGKAGAYAIQGKGQMFVKDIEGDIDTVIGLPVKIIIDFLKDL